MNNLLSNCGLVDAQIGASDKDLPVLTLVLFMNVGVSFSSDYTWLEMKCNSRRVIMGSNH